MGNKLAGLAKATAEKSDHSVEKSEKELAELKGAAPAAEAAAAETGLSPEERKKIIQDNIKRNLAMQQRVREAKSQARPRRGFKAIDRSKQGGARAPGVGGGRGPGGPGGPGMPGGGPGGRPSAGGRAGGRDRRSHRAEKSDEESGQNGGRRRKLLSTEEEDLSGKTEFTVNFPCTVRDFSEASGLKTSMIIAKLFMAGIMAKVNTDPR